MLLISALLDDAKFGVFVAGEEDQVFFFEVFNHLSALLMLDHFFCGLSFLNVTWSSWWILRSLFFGGSWLVDVFGLWIGEEIGVLGDLGA